MDSSQDLSCGREEGAIAVKAMDGGGSDRQEKNYPEQARKTPGS